MSRKSPPATALAGAALVLLSGVLIVAAAHANAETTAAPNAAAACGELFDDFNYASAADPLINAHNWSVRTNPGGPGIPGASWPAENVTFPTADGQKVLQLTAYTDGTPGGTAQAELLSAQRRFYEGTYASRIKFTDAPVSGNDGDHVVETFFTITPLNAPLDPSYGEIDFEYLPNGGWGEPSNIMYETTWETYQAEPWLADNIHGEQRRSFAGWHDMVFTVADGRVRYYIDGELVADHGDKYYPETPMSINFNLWFIDAAAHSGGRSTYVQQVDYLYFSDGEVISPAEAKSRVNGFRSAGTSHTDTVGAGGTCPTTPPTSQPPTSQPPTSQPPTPPPGGCATAPAWDWGTVYLEGARVRHNNRLWQANWWTLGSEPGRTAQWRDLGAC